MSDMRYNERQPPRGGTAGQPPRDARNTADQVRDAAGTVRDEAAGVLSDVKAEVAEVAQATREQAEGFAEEQKAAGARHAETIARAVHRAADELQETAPQFATYVREAGDAASSLARNMRDRSLGSLAGEVQEMARRQPMAFFGVAVLAGFALSRFVKSSSDGLHHAPDGHARREGPPAAPPTGGMGREGAPMPPATGGMGPAAMAPRGPSVPPASLSGAPR